jgi:hypothetical protein
MCVCGEIQQRKVKVKIKVKVEDAVRLGGCEKARG